MTRRWLAWMALGLVAGAAAPAWAQARYDGAWSVLVVTEAGTCDRAYRFAITISNGAVAYAGEAGIDLTGRVSRSGSVSVTVRRGQQMATGRGRMTRAGGSGTWSGRAGARQCSGYWEVERRRN